jgi:Transposase
LVSSELLKEMDTPTSSDCELCLSLFSILMSLLTKKALGGTPWAPRPLPQDTVDHGARYSIAAKIQALTLVSSGFSTKYVEEKISIPQQTVARIRKTAFQRGFRPDEDPRILEYYVKDVKRSGRLKTITKAIEQKVLASVREDSGGREKSSEYLGYEVNISRSSVLRILKRHGLTCVKPTRKPILTLKMREARLRFARAHAHWILEDWK